MENVFQKISFLKFFVDFFKISLFEIMFSRNFYSKIFILEISFLNLFSKICCLKFFLEGKNLDKQNFINKFRKKKSFKKNFKARIFGKKVFRKNFVNKFCTYSG